MKTTFKIASATLITLLSFSAIGDATIPATAENSSANATPSKVMQEIAQNQLLAQINKYGSIVSLAGSRQDELAASRNEATSAYINLWKMKVAIESSHNPNWKDFQAFDTAAKSYSNAYKSFINLQKSILAQSGLSPVEALASTTDARLITGDFCFVDSKTRVC